MSRSLLLFLCAGCCAVIVGEALAQPNVRTWADPVDAVVRRTDEGNDDELVPGTLPDLLSVSLSGWSPTNPTQDPYEGSVPEGGANILKLELVFRGLVNPPGPIQFPDIPTMFGPSPVYGFLDLDVDEDIETGGELASGRFNYLEQVARFGALPTAALTDRAVSMRCQVDFDYETQPFYERSGSDFTLSFCGCTPIEIDARLGGDDDDDFEEGETWIISGRFFQRNGGYLCASIAYQEAPGSMDGLYDPVHSIRFKHLPNNTTAVTIVFPLTQLGASMLTGQPPQLPPDHTFNGSSDFSHFSVQEGLNDVIVAVTEGEVSSSCNLWASRWLGRSADDYLDVTRWRATALFGTTYAEHPLGASYVWTDAGFSHTVGDVTGDGLVNGDDRAEIESFIAAFDGNTTEPCVCPCVLDCDEVVNGSVMLCNFAHNYNVRDLNYDGFVNSADLDLMPGECRANWDGLNGVSTSDFFAFLEDFFAGDADFNRDGATDSADFLEFLASFFMGCP